MRFKTTVLCVALLSGLVGGAASASADSYKLVAKIPLPAKPGHGDMVNYDPGNGYVYVSMTEGGAVIDTKTNKIVHIYPSLITPNDNAFSQHYVYWTSTAGPGKTNQIVVISKKTWKVVDRIDTVGTTPDGLQVDTQSHKLYVMIDDNNWVDVYSTGKAPAFETKYPLYPAEPPGSGPDVGVLVPSKQTLFMPDDSWEEAVNTETGKITEKVNTLVKVTSKGGTKGQFLDPADDTLWVGTSTAAGGLLVFKPDNLQIIKRLPQTGGADQVVLDPKLGLAYGFEASAKGFDVYDTKTMEHVGFVSTGTTETHSGDVDTADHDVYVYAGGASEVLVYKPEK